MMRPMVSDSCNDRLLFSWRHDGVASLLKSGLKMSLLLGSWKPEAVKKTHLDHLLKLELIIEPMSIENRFEGTTTAQVRKRIPKKQDLVLFITRPNNTSITKTNIHCAKERK